MKIIDIKDMPGFEHKTGFKGNNAVTDGKIYLKPLADGKPYPHCVRHGAINCRAIRKDGRLFRCSELGCDEGCFIPNEA